MENNLVMEDSWDDVDLSDLTDNSAPGEESPEMSAGEEQIWEAVEEDGGTEETEADQPTDTDVQGQDTFTLHYMGQERSVTREEVVPLAQKGMDYDRVKGRLEEANNTLRDYDRVRKDLDKRNEQVQWLEELAREQGLSLNEWILDSRAQAMAQRTGKAPEVCRGILVNRQKELELQNRQDGMTAAQGKKARLDAEIGAFMKAYPEIASDPKKVPQEVWDEVKRGDTLVSAYRAYELKQLRAQLAQQQAREDKLHTRFRSTGSQSTRGTKTVDPFDAIWYDDD